MTIWICDVHGVLVDTPALIRDAFAATAARYGFALTPADYQRVKGLPLVHAYRSIDRAGDAAVFARRHYHVRYVRERIAAVRTYPFVREMLSTARAHGVRIGAATSNGEIAESCLVQTELYSQIDCLVTQEEVTHPKPHPESLLRVLALMPAGTRMPDTARALFVGDTDVDVAAGKAAGVWTVGVSYGVSSDAEIRAAGPDDVIGGFDQMRRYLPARTAAAASVGDSVETGTP